MQRGVKLVQLRAHDLTEADYRARAESALALCRQHGARLLLNAGPSLLQQVEADGIHLTRWRLQSYSERPIPSDRLLSVACHSVQELEQANRLRADLATVSPVKPTPSHPEVTPLGWQHFHELSEHAQMPVYGLGGLENSELKRIQALGGQGIAGIRAFW